MALVFSLLTLLISCTPQQVLITKGEEVMSTYEDTKTASGKPMKRCFCSKCGSALLSKPTAFEGLVLVHPVGMDKMTWGKGFPFLCCEHSITTILVPTKEYHPQDRWEWIGELKSIVE